MITSLLDNDYYACTMSNAVFMAGDGDLQVRYEFRNRTFAVPLATRLNLGVLHDTLEKIRQLRFQPAEIAWLREQGTFSDGWLAALPSFVLPEVEIGQTNGHLTMRYEGSWAQVIFWESILLAVINEMYYGRFGLFAEEGVHRLKEKIDYLQERGSLRFAEFGTRRRFSGEWQHYVVHKLAEEVPDLMVGTSNAALAMELGLRPIGTMAHQMFMVYTAIHMDQYLKSQPALGRDLDDPIARGIHTVLWHWTQAYKDHPELMTVLPDTYGTEAFIERAFPADLAPFNGFRQDSGDAIFRSRQLAYYAFENLGKPSPLIIPSDSLDVRKMSVIEDNFKGRTMPVGMEPSLVFGWGTNLTNDLGYEPLSIVVKPSHVLSNGVWLPCVKISDDPQKIHDQNNASLRYWQVLGVRNES